MSDAPPSSNDPNPSAPPPLPPRAPDQGSGPVGPAGPFDWRTLFWVFFRFDGRVGRQVYWLSLLLLTAIVGVSGVIVIDPDTGVPVWEMGPIQSLIYTAASISSITISVKRLHDLNMTGFFALGMLIPPIMIILTIWLGVRKGDSKPNRFGWESDAVPTRAPPDPLDEDDA
ncbi:MAG: DUF805 domain-containing protein [Pseudomonadota bacterium]